jgi:hypothetical protein
VDIILAQQAELNVKLGDQVVGGRTVIARFAEPAGVGTSAQRNEEQRA